jgi:carboxylate-amine ligase
MSALDDVDRGTPCPDVPTTLLRSAEWRAARYGLNDGLLDPLTGTERPAGAVVTQLLHHVEPSLERTGEADRLRAGVAGIVSRGTGADRQRAAYATATDHAALVRSLIEPTRPSSTC